MKHVIVRFGENEKEYVYLTKLDLIPGAKYRIVNEQDYDYHDAVITVVDYMESRVPTYGRLTNTLQLIYRGPLHEIVKAVCIDAPKVEPEYTIVNIYENFKKGITTVLWSDGDKTMLNCDPWEDWDREKVIGLAFMKKHYHNRGCFNNEIRKWCGILDSRMEKKDNETYA